MNKCKRCRRPCVRVHCTRCIERLRKTTGTIRPKGLIGDRAPLPVELNGVILSNKLETLREQEVERAYRVVIYRQYIDRHGQLDMQAALAEAEAAERRAA